MRGMRLAGFVVGVMVLCFAAPVWATGAAAPSISSVVFTGSQAQPVITITGTGFGTRPASNPSYAPPALTHPLCPVKPALPLPRYGLDYGTSLYLLDTSQHPAWAAGRYRPGARELDCIGLLIARYTPTTIEVRLGAAYPEVRGYPAHYALASGDAYVVSVAGVRFSGRVRYR